MWWSVTLKKDGRDYAFAPAYIFADSKEEAIRKADKDVTERWGKRTKWYSFNKSHDFKIYVTKATKQHKKMAAESALDALMWV